MVPGKTDVVLNATGMPTSTRLHWMVVDDGLGSCASPCNASALERIGGTNSSGMVPEDWKVYECAMQEDQRLTGASHGTKSGPCSLAGEGILQSAGILLPNGTSPATSEQLRPSCQLPRAPTRR